MNRHAEACAALGAREREILILMSRGIGEKMTAQQAGLSWHTVRSYTKVIRAKLGVSNMTQAAVIATKGGLL